MRERPGSFQAPGAAPEAGPAPPHSIEAEQQVLGAILVNNAIWDAVAAEISAQHFYDPVHRDIFEAARTRIEKNALASPVTLKAFLESHAGLKELGGPAYLARLAGAAISAYAASDYARLIRDLATARDLLAAADAARDALLGCGIEPGDAIAQVAGALDKAVEKASRTVPGRAPVSWLRAMTDAIAGVNRAYQGDDPPGVPSGIPALEKIVGRLVPGDLAVLGGRPGMGKSAVALNIAMRAAAAGHPVVYGAFEMMPEALAIRGLSDAASDGYGAIAYAEALRGTLSEDDFRRLVDVARAMEALPIMFLPRAFGEVSAFAQGVRRALRRMAGVKGMPLVLCDYLQLMDVAGASRFEKVTEISRGLKGLAMTEGFPLLALAQLNRGVEHRDDKRPMMADLRESGQIEQDADTVMFAYREEYYLERERPKGDDYDALYAWEQAMEAARGKLDIICAKVRQGAPGTAHLRFTPATNSIGERGA